MFLKLLPAYAYLVLRKVVYVGEMILQRKRQFIVNGGSKFNTNYSQYFFELPIDWLYNWSQQLDIENFSTCLTCHLSSYDLYGEIESNYKKCKMPRPCFLLTTKRDHWTNVME